LIANAATSLFLTGLIWFVQIVHYPLFAATGDAYFAAYAAEHARRTTAVVALPMLVELGSALGIVAFHPAPVSLAGAALVVLIWISTAALQVPCHNQLRQGFDAACHRRLVSSNWIRTLAWTLRSCIAVYLLQQLT